MWITFFPSLFDLILFSHHSREAQKSTYCILKKVRRQREREHCRTVQHVNSASEGRKHFPTRRCKYPDEGTAKCPALGRLKSTWLREASGIVLSVKTMSYPTGRGSLRGKEKVTSKKKKACSSLSRSITLSGYCTSSGHSSLASFPTERYT